MTSSSVERVLIQAYLAIMVTSSGYCGGRYIKKELQRYPREQEFKTLCHLYSTLHLNGKRKFEEDFSSHLTVKRAGPWWHWRSYGPNKVFHRLGIEHPSPWYIMMIGAFWEGTTPEQMVQGALVRAVEDLRRYHPKLSVDLTVEDNSDDLGLIGLLESTGAAGTVVKGRKKK